MTMSAEMRRAIKQEVARQIGMAETGRATALGKNDQIKGRGNGKGTDPVRRIFGFGLRSVPVEGSEGIVVMINGGKRSGGAAVLIAAENLKYGPQDLKGGETALYSQFDAIIRLDKDGNITVVPKAGAKVKLGSATDSELDQLVTKAELNEKFKLVRDVFDPHTHPAGPMVAGMTPVTGSTAAPNSGFGAAPAVIGSPNVLGRKP